MHPVLRGESPIDLFAKQTHQSLLQADGQPFAFRFSRHHGWRQLTMITGQNDSLSVSQGNPTARFGTLASFINHQRIKLPVGQNHWIDRGGSTNDLGRVQNLLDGFSFMLSRLLHQFTSFIAQRSFLARLRSCSRISIGLTL